MSLFLKKTSGYSQENMTHGLSQHMPEPDINDNNNNIDAIRKYSLKSGRMLGGITLT
jgi:hypothetical protein